MIKKTILLLLVTSAGMCKPVWSQNKPMQKLTAAIEQLRLAMIHADKSMLEKLTSDQLSYGHSSGAVDNKTDFIDKIVSGRSDFVTIDLLEQTIAISAQTAIVRHILKASTNDNGQPGTVHLRVLQVWQKKGKNWKILARQAVKIT
jgi:hypothetical protein